MIQAIQRRPWPKFERDPFAYEHEQREAIRRTDWAGLHTNSDRAAPVTLPDARKWRWA